MSEPVTNPKPRKPGRGLRIALVLSVMLNLLVVGVLIGGAMRVARIDGPGLPGQPDVRALWRALPSEARSELRAMGRERGFPGEHGPRLSREERRARSAEMNARILEVLRTEPFDGAAFASLMDGDREALELRLQAAREAFVAEVADLSPAERREMAERLQEEWSERHHD